MPSRAALSLFHQLSDASKSDDPVKETLDDVTITEISLPDPSRNVRPRRYNVERYYFDSIDSLIELETKGFKKLRKYFHSHPKVSLKDKNSKTSDSFDHQVNLENDVNCFERKYEPTNEAFVACEQSQEVTHPHKSGIQVNFQLELNYIAKETKPEFNLERLYVSSNKQDLIGEIIVNSLNSLSVCYSLNHWETISEISCKKVARSNKFSFKIPFMKLYDGQIFDLLNEDIRINFYSCLGSNHDCKSYEINLTRAKKRNDIPQQCYESIPMDYYRTVIIQI